MITDGYYAYIDTRFLSSRVDQRARIISPMQEAGHYCMSVWYYTHRLSENVINVYHQTTSNDTSIETVMFSKRLDLGEEWVQSTIDFHFSENDKVLVYYIMKFNIMIKFDTNRTYISLIYIHTYIL